MSTTNASATAAVSASYPPESLATAVNVFFDRAERMAPKFVSSVPSIVAGILVGLLLLLVGIRPVLKERSARHATPMLEYRWTVMLAVLVAVSVTVARTITDLVFHVSNLQTNRQHIVNLKWLPYYRDALRL